MFVEGHDVKLQNVKAQNIWVSINVSFEEIHIHTNIH